MSHLDIDLVGGGNELLKFGRGFIESCCGDVGHENVGSFPREKNACFETDTTGRCKQMFVGGKDGGIFRNFSMKRKAPIHSHRCFEPLESEYEEESRATPYHVDGSSR